MVVMAEQKKEEQSNKILKYLTDDDKGAFNYGYMKITGD
jgi:hypothetical protein